MTSNPRMPQRTHTCGELTAAHIGQDTTLLGWVYRRRDHGNLIFIDLRDREGFTQVVFRLKGTSLDPAMVKSLRAEYVIAITGAVRARPAGTVNPHVPTGAVEVSAADLTVLNTAETPPFPVDEETALSEEVQLAYRYIDLRRPAKLDKLKARHRVVKALRDAFDAHGFLEIETPMLTRSTPEGARDYLVPSRLNPGAFFALPQSPQLFKQLLMVAGVERYVQIAKCFRDEDLRSDRQPEFTQVDLEMSFVDEEAILQMVETVLTAAMRASCQIDIPTPFPRVTHREAMERHGTDAPDLRQEQAAKGAWAFCWVTEFPLFAYDQTLQRWHAEHHPFTAPHPDDCDHLEQAPDRVRSRAYDLVLNGVELGSGSIRIHDPALQQRVFHVLGMDDAEIERRFGFLVRALRYGAPPHGGFALGLDRWMALLTGCDSIRDVIAFPKTQRGACLMTGAPAAVDERQLKDLQLRMA